MFCTLAPRTPDAGCPSVDLFFPGSAVSLASVDRRSGKLGRHPVGSKSKCSSRRDANPLLSRKGQTGHQRGCARNPRKRRGGDCCRHSTTNPSSMLRTPNRLHQWPLTSPLEARQLSASQSSTTSAPFARYEGVAGQRARVHADGIVEAWIFNDRHGKLRTPSHPL